MRQLYFIFVTFFSTGVFAKTSTSLMVPTNDLCSAAVVLSPSLNCVITSGTFNGAVLDGGAVGCATDAVQDVWYKFTATDATMGVYVSAASGANPAFQVLQGGCNGTVIACVNTNGMDQAEGYMDVNFVAGQEYYLRVMNAGGFFSTSSFTVCVRNYPAPVNDWCANATSLTPGTSCSYTVGSYSGALKDGGAVGCATDAVQDVWYKFTATDATMTISITTTPGANPAFQVLQGSCDGTVIACVNSYGIDQAESYTNTAFVSGEDYYIRVLNADGYYSTASFYICVYGAVQPCAAAVTIAASATSICAGSSITFTATPINGGTTPNYQWKRNGLNVGTNNPMYSTNNLSNDDVITVVMTSSASCASVATVESNALSVNVNQVNTAVVQQNNLLNAVATAATYQWIDCTSNQPINGATANSFTATANGSYAVVVTQNGCSALSDCVVVNNLSSTSFESSSIVIYPNPVSDVLFFDTPIPMDVSILDIRGTTLLHQCLVTGLNSIDVSTLLQGIYFVQTPKGLHYKFVVK